MAPQPQEEIGPPGAGTLWVYDQAESHSDWETLPTTQPTLTPSPDTLLSRGIADYTYIPRSHGGILGRGKFSTVYRVRSGAKDFALKHTPLHPHHPLIAARLLREPTLLAQLTPHPCLIGVDGFVRTDGHFYLVEECAASHVPLPQHPTPIAPSRAAYILDQMVSVVRDSLHAGRVCHRDLKGDNILIDVKTGDILLLDLGLATHYSASEPKLTTCCGSPAFHSPEIVHALNHRPGEVTYYGPEIDIWCIALTMLALLLRARFPLGPKHTSRHVMAERAAEALQLLDDLYPPDEPWRGLGPSVAVALSEEERQLEEESWGGVRRALANFTLLDAKMRMAAFADYDVGGAVRARVAQHAKKIGGKSFKTTTFVPSDVKYTLPLYLEPSDDEQGNIELRNPTGEPERRVVSYIKYLLRCAGILYHHIPDTSPVVLQLVLPLGPPPPPDAKPRELPPQNENWVSNFLGLRRPPPVTRSSSVPPPTNRTLPAKPQGETRGKRAWAQQAWLRIEVERSGPSRPASRSTSQAGSRAPSQAGSRAPSQAGSRAPSQTGSRVQSRAPSASSSRAHSRAPSRAGSRPPASRPPSRPPSRGGHREHAADPTALTNGLNAISNTHKPPLHLNPALPPHPPKPVPPHILRPAYKRAMTQPSSPLARAVSQPATKTPTTSPPISPTAPLRRVISATLSAAPRVVLSVSEPRGVPLIRAALATATPPPFDHSYFSPQPTPAMAISSPVSASASEEIERGRPRSKETPPDRNESSTPKPNGRKSSVKVKGRSKEKKEPSMLLEGMFGKEGAMAIVSPAERHRRSSSVPPISASPEIAAA